MNAYCLRYCSVPLAFFPLQTPCCRMCAWQQWPKFGNKCELRECGESLWVHDSSAVTPVRRNAVECSLIWCSRINAWSTGRRLPLESAFVYVLRVLRTWNRRRLKFKCSAISQQRGNGWCRLIVGGLSAAAAAAAAVAVFACFFAHCLCVDQR